MGSRFLVVIALMAVVCVPRAAAWWCTGHMLIGEIAKQLLTDEVQQYFQKDIDNYATKYDNIDTFPEASCWADDIKTTNHDYDTWHYCNGCYAIDGVKCPANLDCDILTKALPTSLKYLTSTSSTQDQKSFYLLFMLHFVGDAHQPLHTTELFSNQFPSGDRGGNSFKVTFESKSTNLHAFYDSVAEEYATDEPRPFSSNPDSEKFVTSTATQLINQYTFSPSEVAFTGDFSIYTNQSYRVAVTTAYQNGTLRSGATLSSSYADKAFDASARLLALAGHRLASVLEYVYQTNTGRN